MSSRDRSHFAVGLLAVAWLAACSSGGGPTPTAPGEPEPALVEFDSYTLVNSARAVNSVQPPLQLREAIAAVARAHSRRMRDDAFFGHADPEGRTVADRLAEAGIPFATTAENLAMTVNIADPASWAHGQLMQSSEHRPNILNPAFQLVGVGVARDGGSYWITQVFVGL
jgi:uncharacterized protein YkwD